jgi:hypothetical protein
MPSPELMVPLTAILANETGQSGLPNRAIRFVQFQVGAFGSCLFRV